MQIENMGSENYTGPAVELMGRGRLKKWIARRSKTQRGLLRAASGIATSGLSTMRRRRKDRRSIALMPTAGGVKFGRRRGSIISRSSMPQAAISSAYKAKKEEQERIEKLMGDIDSPIQRRDVPEIDFMGGRLRKKIKAKLQKIAKKRPLLAKLARATTAAATGGASEIARSKKARKVAAAIATGGASAAASRIAKKGGAKAITRTVAAIATGGASELFTKKKTKIGRAMQAFATGGASALARGLHKRGGGRSVGRGIAAIATGGASELFTRKKTKAGKIIRGFATGGLSMPFEKGKMGSVSRKVAGYMFAPVTTSAIGLSKKIKAAKAMKAEAAAAEAEATAEAQEAAALDAAAAEAAANAPGAKTKKALPWIIGGAAAVAVPFLLGE